MAKFIQAGEVIDFIATAAVSAGDLVAFGDKAGVVARDGGVGENVGLYTRGVYECPCASQTIAVGATLYLAEGKATTTKASTGAVVLGRAVTAATTSDTAVRVLL